MSYDIIYRKAFIKLDDERAVAVIESGSNNCYSVVDGKRARNFHSTQMFGSPIITKEIVDDWVKNERIRLHERYPIGSEDAFNENHWGWYSAISLYGKGTTGTSLKSFGNWFLLGIKQAKTIEEWNEVGVNFYFQLNYAQYSKEDNTLPLNILIESTEFLLEKFPELHKQGLYYISTQDGNNLKRYEEKKKLERKVAKRNEPKEQLKEYFVLYNKGYGMYLRKFSARKMFTTYTPDSLSTKKFKTKPQAESYLKNSKRAEYFGEFEVRFHSELN